MYDYREVARELQIYSSDPLAGPGLPLWLPNGAAVREEIQKFAKDLARAGECESVYSPVLGKENLYAKSGHLAKFDSDMFPPIELGDERYRLRPANCPHHCLIYKSSSRSYRDLPLRFNELASMFRAEQSGAVGGLHRVREIHLDDTHVFCRQDQLEEEALRGLRAALQAQEALELPISYVRLSLRDASPSYLGSDDEWARAEAALRKAADQCLPGIGLKLVAAEGEAAFYGPKLDLQIVDERGEESVATVQIDFAMPERFGLDFVNEQGQKERVVMVHRGAVGSMERIMAHLLSLHGLRLPFWLSPLQAVVLPVKEEQKDRAQVLHQELAMAGIRSKMLSEGRLGSRIREARLAHGSVILVLGAKEVESGSVQVNIPAYEVQANVGQEQLVKRLQDLHSRRRPKKELGEGWER